MFVAGLCLVTFVAALTLTPPHPHPDPNPSPSPSPSPKPNPNPDPRPDPKPDQARRVASLLLSMPFTLPFDSRLRILRRWLNQSREVLLAERIMGPPPNTITVRREHLVSPIDRP